MKNLRERITNLAAEGLCCSQIILSIGMENYGLSNPELIKASRGLCGGLNTGLACGSLTGSACLISLLIPPPGSMQGIRELKEWFTNRYGKTDCYPLLEENPELEAKHCLSLVEETLLKTLELIDAFCII